jgi:uncharacterized membrane protein
MWKVRGFAKVLRGQVASGQCFNLLASADDQQLAIATRDDLVRLLKVNESTATEGAKYSFTEQLRFTVEQPRVLAWGNHNTLWVGNANGVISQLSLASPSVELE